MINSATEINFCEYKLDLGECPGTTGSQGVPGINFIPDKVVIVDDYMTDDGSAQDNGSVSSMTNCMQYSSMVYTCPSFQAALEISENNTIINITTNAVLLQSIVH